MGRAPCCDKANVKKGPWSPEEDEKLKAYIQHNGTGGNWIALPHKMGLRRCGKSCRLRWLNYLRPNLKHGGFTEQEDNIICTLYISIGSRWSIIAAQLPGRTDNDIKNYWNTKLKKKLMHGISTSRRCFNNNQSANSSEFKNLSNSALERLAFSSSYYINNNNNPSLCPNFNHPQAADYRDVVKQEELVNCMNSAFPITEAADIIKANNGISDSGFTEAEIDDLLNNDTSSQLTTGININPQFDCFKQGLMELEGADAAWWSTQFPTTCWDNSDVTMQLHQSYVSSQY